MERGVVEELSLPLDAAGFLRRECPRCKAQFKVRWSRREAAVVATALAERVGHLNAVEVAPPPFPRHCAYCGFQAAPEAWWTREARAWLDARAKELRDELRWRRLRVPWDALHEEPHPTYLPVAPRHEPAELPVDDADDLVAVPLPCCGAEARVSDGWVGPVRCHYCGFVHARQATRDIGLELALLRSWVE